jgi:ferredoxin--NADP+ reductase
LTVAGYDRERGTITLVVQEVGKTTMAMGTMSAGDCLASFAGPLGNPSEIKNDGTVLCVGGGFAIAPVYPIARALKGAGNAVLSIIGARSRNLLFWEDKMRAVSDELIVCTDDGSYGRKGMVTLPIQELLEAGRAIARLWAIGPALMMKACALTAQPCGVRTVVSLNSIMIDGTGMCGGCRVEVGGQTRYACVDGPEFDGQAVNWDLLMSRQRIYLEQEREAIERWQSRAGALGS